MQHALRAFTPPSTMAGPNPCSARRHGQALHHTDDMASTSVSVTNDEAAQLDAVQAALASDDIAQLVALTRTATSLVVREACCMALSSFAEAHETDEAVSLDVMRDVFGALVYSLRARPTTRNVLAAGLYACNWWITQKSNQTRVLAGEAGAVGAAVSAMCTDATDEITSSAPQRGDVLPLQLQKLGCRLLDVLLFKTPENVRLAKDSQTIGAVLTAMRGHHNCKAIQVSACNTLYHATAPIRDITSQGLATAVLCHDAKTNCDTAVALGAVELMAAKLLDADEDLSLTACQVLVNLSITLEGRLRAQRCGAFGSVLEMMSRCATKEYVQGTACMALGEIMGNDGAVAVGARLGACALARIVSTMRRFPDNVPIQNNACSALCRLFRALTPKDNGMYVDDAMACVIHALQAHKGASTVQVHACMALEKLFDCHPANRAEAWRLGALPALVQVLETHVVSPEVVESCLGALSSLVSSPFPVVLVRGDAVQLNALSHAMVAAMSAHSDVPSIKQVSSKVLGCLETIGLAVQAREEAELRADAMAAALIAEEEAERAAQGQIRSSRSGNKKRAGGGAGVACTEVATSSLKVETAAAQVASAAAPLAALTLDEHADDTSAPSAAALRRRRRAAAKATRQQSAGAAEASDSEDVAAKLADAAVVAVSAFPSDDAASGVDDASAAASSAAAALMEALRLPPAPVPSTPPMPLPPLPLAASTAQHGASSAAAFTPPVASLKECCVCFIDIPAAEQVVLVPCGHRCMCDECWRERLQPREPAVRLCPICHTPVLTAVRVFDA